jgi:hypothetical protein
MPNNIYRDRIINKIDYAVKEAKNAARVHHAGLIGRIRELSISSVFQPMLPSGFEIGTGKICDRDGQLSPETDLIIYSKSILPPIMYSEQEGIFPIDACFYAVEVKSQATASKMKDAIQKAEELVTLNYPKPENEPKNLSIVIPAFFAFGSDLSDSGTTELQRYAKYHPEWDTDPVLRVICVVGQGYWYFNYKNRCWKFLPPTQTYDEVIGLVSGVVNTLAEARLQTRLAYLEPYLMLRRSATNVIE